MADRELFQACYASNIFDKALGEEGCRAEDSSFFDYFSLIGTGKPSS